MGDDRFGVPGADVSTQGDGCTSLSGFPSGALFTDRVRRSGHEGGYRVVGAGGLAELSGITSVDAITADAGAVSAPPGWVEAS